MIINILTNIQTLSKKVQLFRRKTKNFNKIFENKSYLELNIISRRIVDRFSTGIDIRYLMRKPVVIIYIRKIFFPNATVYSNPLRQTPVKILNVTYTSIISKSHYELVSLYKLKQLGVKGFQ